MFAYCLNNPGNLTDPFGNCCTLFGYRIIDCGNTTCPTSSVYQDTSGNTPGTTIGSLINGQGSLPYSDASIGLGSYGASGCGVIAIYNAMQLLGNSVSLQDVADEVFPEMIGLGAGGIGPWSLDSYFSNHNIQYTPIYHPSTLYNNVTEGSVFVFTVLNDRNDIFGGFHTMAGQYINGNYRIYNRYNESISYAEYGSLVDGFTKGVWIYGVLIG